MWICGWLRNISYSAVVPLLGWPTMKKSGVLLRGGLCAAADRSADAVMARSVNVVLSPKPPCRRGAELVQELPHVTLVQPPERRFLRMEADRVPQLPRRGRPRDDQVNAQRQRRRSQTARARQRRQREHPQHVPRQNPAERHQQRDARPGG